MHDIGKPTRNLAPPLEIAGLGNSSNIHIGRKALQLLRQGSNPL